MTDSQPLTERPYWLAEALRSDPGTPCPALAGTTHADVCIVGGGYAGLWTAYELHEREPSLEIVLLEADICGAGGSGANGGFFSASWHDLSALCGFFGAGEGGRYAAALARQVDELGDWCVRHQADIDFHHEGILYAQADDWQAEPPYEAVGRLAALGQSERLRPLTANEARAIADSPRFRRGVIAPDSGTVQPAKLARELRRVLLERGVRIYERTPLLDITGWEPEGAAPRARPASPEASTVMSSIRMTTSGESVPHGARQRSTVRHGRVHVTTPQGLVVADDVVLTIGAWAVRRPEFRRAFAVVNDFMAVTEPIPDRLTAIGWTNHTGIADSRENFYYLRRTDDDRIAIGGGCSRIIYDGRVEHAKAVSLHAARQAAAGLAWLFPQLEGVRFTHAWTGPMDMTAALVPFFMTLPGPGGYLHVGLGFSGHGQAATKVGGKILAALTLHIEDEWSSLPVVGPPLSLVPPEPLRWPLVRTVAWAADSGDRAVERGRPRGPVRSLITTAFNAYRASRRRRPR